MRAAAVGEGGEEVSKEKTKSVIEMGADSGGSGTGGRRLWNVIVLEQNPVFESTKLAIGNCKGGLFFSSTEKWNRNYEGYGQGITLMPYPYFI